MSSVVLPFVCVTVMFTCPLYHSFPGLIKIAKFKGASIEFQILENSTSLKIKC